MVVFLGEVDAGPEDSSLGSTSKKAISHAIAMNDIDLLSIGHMRARVGELVLYRVRHVRLLDVLPAGRVLLHRVRTLSIRHDRVKDLRLPEL